MTTSYENCKKCGKTVRCRRIDEKGRIFETEQEGVLYTSAGGSEIILCVECVESEEADDELEEAGEPC